MANEQWICYTTIRYEAEPLFINHCTLFINSCNVPKSSYVFTPIDDLNPVAHAPAACTCWRRTQTPP